jgi:phosphate/sulfate permease
MLPGSGVTVDVGSSVAVGAISVKVAVDWKGVNVNVGAFSVEAVCPDKLHANVVNEKITNKMLEIFFITDYPSG